MSEYNNSYTVPAGWVLALSKNIEFHGCNSKDVFSEAGLDLKEMTDSSQRIPVKPVSSAWRIAEKEIGDSCFGIDTWRFITPTTFHALGMALWSSSTLKDALERLARYGRVLNNASIKSFEETEEGWCLTVSVLDDRSGYPLIAYQDLDGFFASLLSICRTLYREDYNPILLELTRNKPDSTDKHSDFFNCPITFEASDNRMFFDKGSIDDPLQSHDAQAARYAENLAAKRLIQLDKSDLSNQVNCQLIDLLPSGRVSEKDVADALNIPLRQLQRRLSSEGTNYRKLLDKTRKDLSLEYMKDDGMSVTEIAYLLGFSDAANFSRAFKRWTGAAPSVYRDLHIK